jgi:DNA-binding protein Fis
VTFYALVLMAMCVLFAVSAAVLLLMAIVQWTRGRGRRAAAYLGLTLVASIVAAGFYVVGHLI